MKEAYERPKNKWGRFPLSFGDISLIEEALHNEIRDEKLSRVIREKGRILARAAMIDLHTYTMKRRFAVTNLTLIAESTGKI